MRDKLAEISLRHLQPNDFIYVSGPLGSYAKVNASGSHEICYKVVTHFFEACHIIFLVPCILFGNLF